jgi:Icc-related predicted phosphoesterase
MHKKLFSITMLIGMLICAKVYGQEKISITHGPYLQNMGTDEVTIVWTTNKNAISWVEIAPDDKSHFYAEDRPKYFVSVNGIKKEGTVHAVKITDLQPATIYRYRVCSEEVLSRNGHKIYYGDIASSEVYTRKPLTFKTNNYNKNEISFAVVNDIHGRVDHMESLLKIAEPYKNDFIFFNGDMVSTMKGEKEVFEGFMDKAVEMFAGEIPMYYCRGNHETRGAFATDFQHYFSPLNPELYFVVRHGPVCFIVLDCGEDKPDHDIEYYGITDYDNYRTKEAEWLKKAVKHKEYLEAPFKVVVCHMPPRNSWHGELEILNKFVPILNDAKVDVMLCGHLHKHIKTEADAAIRFPVLVNSNEALVKGKATNNVLTIDVVNKEGKQQDQITIRR